MSGLFIKPTFDTYFCKYFMFTIGIAIFNRTKVGFTSSNQRPIKRNNCKYIAPDYRVYLPTLFSVSSTRGWHTYSTTEIICFHPTKLLSRQWQSKNQHKICSKVLQVVLKASFITNKFYSQCWKTLSIHWLHKIKTTNAPLFVVSWEVEYT